MVSTFYSMEKIKINTSKYIFYEYEYKIRYYTNVRYECNTNIRLTPSQKTFVNTDFLRILNESIIFSQ